MSNILRQFDNILNKSLMSAKIIDEDEPHYDPNENMECAYRIKLNFKEGYDQEYLTNKLDEFYAENTYPGGNIDAEDLPYYFDAETEPGYIIFSDLDVGSPFYEEHMELLHNFSTFFEDYKKVVGNCFTIDNGKWPITQNENTIGFLEAKNNRLYIRGMW
jgi:hypothetical protein